MFKKNESITLDKAGKIVPIELGLLKHVLKKSTNHTTLTLWWVNSYPEILPRHPDSLPCHPERSEGSPVMGSDSSVTSFPKNDSKLRHLLTGDGSCRVRLYAPFLILSELNCWGRNPNLLSSNVGRKGGYKSQQDNLVISNTNLRVRCKSQHDNLVASNSNREGGYKSQHDNLVISNTNLRVRYKKCLA